MNTKQTSLLLSALLATLFNGALLAATQQEAEAQLDRIPAPESRRVAKQVLNNLVINREMLFKQAEPHLPEKK